jgi:hypothetical protein
MFVKKLKSSRRGFSILGFIQKQMARILSLDYQLDCLDYGDEKWQHADLDFETFKQLQVISLATLCLVSACSFLCNSSTYTISFTCSLGGLFCYCRRMTSLFANFI